VMAAYLTANVLTPARQTVAEPGATAEAAAAVPAGQQVPPPRSPAPQADEVTAQDGPVGPAAPRYTSEGPRSEE